MLKRWMAGIAMVALLAITGISGLTLQADSILYGDVNGDSSVDMKDVLSLRCYLAHLTATVDEVSADANGDTSVDMKDVLLIRQYIAGLVNHLGRETKPSESSSVSSATTTAAEVTTAGEVTTTTAGDITTSEIPIVPTTANNAVALTLRLLKKEKYSENDTTDTYTWNIQKGQAATVTVTLTEVYKANDKTPEELAGLLTMDSAFKLMGNPVIGPTEEQKNDVTYTYTVTVNADATLNGTVAYYDDNPTVTVKLTGGEATTTKAATTTAHVTTKATTTTKVITTTKATTTSDSPIIFDGNVSATLALNPGAILENTAIETAIANETAKHGVAKQYLITVSGSNSPTDYVYPILVGANGTEAWPTNSDGNDYKMGTSDSSYGIVNGSDFTGAGDTPYQLYLYAENGESTLTVAHVKIEVVRESGSTTKSTTVSQATTTKSTKPGETTTRTTIGGSGNYTYVGGVPYITFRSYGDEGTLGTWWWKTSDATNATTCTNYLDFLYKNGVDEIYFYGYYWLSSNKTGLHTFVQKANAKGMTVSLIYDDADAITKSGNTEMNSIATKYLNYCTTYPTDDMAGIHFDVEGVSRDNMIKNMISQFAAARARGVKIAMDVNCGWSSSVTLGGISGFMNIAAANLDCLSLMSYRDTAAKIWSLGANCLTAAKKYGTKIVFGVETGHFDFNEDVVEFYQEGKEVCYDELATVYANLKKDHPTGGYGIAVHDVDWWYKLKNK